MVMVLDSGLVPDLAGLIVLCSWARHCTLIVPLFTQEGVEMLLVT